MPLPTSRFVGAASPFAHLQSIDALRPITSITCCMAYAFWDARADMIDVTLAGGMKNNVVPMLDTFGSK